ncbi:MAG TPA: RNA 2',3'-cyclic phosphodiesterase [bacterium]|nr:RNA 2',3'-cyclic phosphodiesterase [bacterium]
MSSRSEESEEKIRAFVAVEVSEQVRQSLASIQQELKPSLKNARWTGPSAFHLTIKFLGEVSPNRIEQISNMLEGKKVSDRFTMKFVGLGVFPNPRKARVLWAGIKKGSEELCSIFNKLEPEFEALGFEPEKRKFSGHLTLARFKIPAQIQPGILETEADCPECTAASLVLFKSTLKPSGAEYTPIKVFPF